MNTMSKFAVATLAVGLALTGCSSQKATQSDGQWAPDGTVELMVPGAAGGGSDLMTRRFETALTDLGVTSEVRNYSTVESYMQLAAMPGDPDRLLTANYGGGVLTPVTQDLDYSWQSFTPIAIVGEDFSYIVTGADSELNTFQDLQAKAGSGTVTIGQVQSSGQNTQLTHQLEDAMDTSFEPVVFDGGGQQLTATLANDVDISLMEPSEFIDQLEAGQVKALLALGGKSTDERLADVPTAEEAGISTDFVSQWRGFFAAAQISDAQRQWWENAVKSWTDSDDFAKYIDDSLMVPTFLTGAELEKFLTDSVALAESSQL